MRRDPFAEIVAIERLGAPLLKERMLQQAVDRVRVDLPLRRRRTVHIPRGAVARPHEVIEQGVGRSGVAGDRIVLAINKSDVGDATEIEHHDRMRPVERARQRAVEHRNQRRTLPARGNIGRAEIVDHRNAGLARERGPVAELHGQLFLRPVQHRLAVIADDIDAAAVDAVDREKRIHRARMQCGGDFLGLRDHPRPLGASTQGPAPLPWRGARSRPRVPDRNAARSGRSATPFRRPFRLPPRRCRPSTCRSSARSPACRPYSMNPV